MTHPKPLTTLEAVARAHEALMRLFAAQFSWWPAISALFEERAAESARDAESWREYVSKPSEED